MPATPPARRVSAADRTTREARAGTGHRPGPHPTADPGRVPYAAGEAGVMGMSLQARELYTSANGDRWHLVRDPGSGRVFVRHEPNAPSGGRAADLEIADFLRAGGQGPEHQELLRLIGTLDEGGPSSRA